MSKHKLSLVNGYNQVARRRRSKIEEQPRNPCQVVISN